MIASGEKKEEYREIKGFWAKRFTANETKLYIAGIGWTNYTIHKDADDFKKFLGIGVSTEAHYMKRIVKNLQEDSKWRSFDTVTFKNGYSKDSPTICLEFKGFEVGKAKPEWSDNWQGDVFIIKLGDILTLNTP